MLFNRLLLCLSLLLLPACVFTPLYYQSASDNCHFNISAIPEREGQFLRNLLREKLRFVPPESSSCYHVNVALGSSNASAGYNTDLTTTITRVTFTATVSVRDDKMNEVTNFTSKVADFYINAISTYATTKAEEDIKNRILVALANDITTKISIALKVPHVKRP